ncbi:MAG: ABC transporter permease [Proteobacteria bacterium]|nr:ABC transporter permease [Pseudomonadota bacterium]MBU1698367.1 ABC transporter permease [Pseudomonadota bacterium]
MTIQTKSYEMMAREVSLEHRKVKWFQLQLLLKRKAAFLSLIILLLALAAALFAPFIAPYPGQGQGNVNLEHRLIPPSSDYILGTDIYGRDMLSRVLFGARVSLFGGICIVFFAALIGIPLGLWSGYNEGISGALISRTVELFLSFPSTLIAMAISILIGVGWFTAIIALIVPWWPWYTRLVQGEVLSIKQTLYVEAAQMLGYGKIYIIFRHILPNIMTPVMVMILLDLGPAIIAIGLLSFIGLGTQPPMADWGLMVWEGAPNILSEWWISIVPGCAMFIVVIAFNIFGDALKDILDSNG